MRQAGQLLALDLRGGRHRRRRGRTYTVVKVAPARHGQPPRRRWRLPLALVALAVLAYVIFALVRSVPDPSVTATRSATEVIAGHPASLAWPGQGQAAIAVQGAGVIASHDADTATPIASVTKVMTAYLVLRDHPLRTNADGPSITVSADDVAAYRADLASGQSVVAVRAGESLTERQALEGLLLPSGNNIATMLARWDAGSELAFVAKMNAAARALGMTRTRYTSASGVLDSTVSSALDQTRLGMVAIQIPVLTQIASMRQATLPIAGPQLNKDTLVGTNGVFGVKPGTTSHAGGCFVFAAHEKIAGRTVTVVGAILHQAAGQLQPVQFASVFHATTKLLASSRRVVVVRPVVARGAILAWVKAPWAAPVALQAAAPVSVVGWPGLAIHTRVVTRSPVTLPLSAGENVGTAVITAGGQRQTVGLVAARPLPGPSLGWRLKHP